MASGARAQSSGSKLILPFLTALGAMGALAMALEAPNAEIREISWGCLGVLVLLTFILIPKGRIKSRAKAAAEGLAKGPLDEAETNERLAIWLAISELWLDNEMSDGEVKFIAQRLAQSKYSLEELEGIYLYEVGPVVHENLRQYEGVQKTFPQNWLREEILARMTDKDFRHIPPEKIAYMTEYTTEYWDRIKGYIQDYWDAGV